MRECVKIEDFKIEKPMKLNRSGEKEYENKLIISYLALYFIIIEKGNITYEK